MWHPVSADPAAVHAVSVERDRNMAVCIQRDGAAVAAHRGDLLVDHFSGGKFEWLAHLGHFHADFVRGHRTNIELTPAGSGHGATGIRISAGTYNGRIADASPALVGHAA